MATVSLYLCLGSNLGDRKDNIMRAIRLLEKGLGSSVASLSPIVETEPWGYESPNRYLNACALFRISGKEPFEDHCMQILSLCKETENALGRVQRHPGEGYSDRPIDIDILFYGTKKMDTPSLTIPHPRIAVREFVMVPLRKIARGSVRKAFPEIFRRPSAAENGPAKAGKIEVDKI